MRISKFHPNKHITFCYLNFNPNGSLDAFISASHTLVAMLMKLSKYNVFNTWNTYFFTNQPTLKNFHKKKLFKKN